MTNKQEFDAAGFYEALGRAVRARKVNWKEVSADTGVSQTTLTRMGQGRRPDAASLAALSAWAGINPGNFVPGRFAHAGGGERTLDKVALLFRQDSRLTDDARKKLESIVESAYEALKSDDPDEGPKP